MSLRAIANKVLALSPLLLMAAVCVRCRFYTDSFEPLVPSAEQEAVISAYIEPVKATLQAHVRTAEPAVVRSVANLWISEWNDGKLKPMLPCALDDTMRGPIKNQVYFANQSVASALTQLARKESAGGDYLRASKDLLLAIRTTEIPKYSDPVTVFIFADEQRHDLNLLSLATAHLSESERGALKHQLVALQRRQIPLGDLYSIVKFANLHDSERARTNETASYDSVQASEVGFTQDSTSYKAAVAQIRSGAKRVLITPYLQDIKLAIGSQGRFATALGGAIVDLNASLKAAV